MNLNLLEEDPYNTVFVRPEDGFPVYHVETPMRFFGSATTTIKKINGATDNVMATIGLHAFSQEVNVWGRNITPVRAHMFTTSEKFIASDGRSYKWKTDWGIFQLILNDRSHTPIAFYDSGSLGILSAARLPSLQTTPDGVPIIDEIVATFIYVLQVQKRRRRR
ncbi:hypothetical protein C8J56DRAFT_951631 [Mycena floridula]|nr:hypothetical protein C8J56DRAFT_951631 [Mycena floridula]